MVLIIYKINDNLREKVANLFEDKECTIQLSYLQGHMGSGWVNDLENPTAAQIMVGIFVFYGGDANAEGVDELLCNLPEHSLVVVSDEQWKKRIEEIHKGSADKFQRFKFEKDPQHLSKDHLKGLISKLPEGYELKKIDEEIARGKSLHEVSEDFTSQFDSIEDYLDRGIGYCILKDGRVVSGASSFSIYDGGIEIEVGTDPEHRKKGLATVVSAALMLQCLESGKYPSWDAANPQSVVLAKKLGYVYKEPYDTYYIHYKG